MSGPITFISSTYDDLKDIREGLKGYLENVGYIPKLFEGGEISFQSDQALDEDCYKAVAESDMFISLVGERYGSPTSQSKKKKKKYKSISKKEFETAFQENLPIYVFVQKSVERDYKVYERNGFNREIKYQSVDDVQTLEYLRWVYQKVGRTNFVYPFEDLEDITSVLKLQFANIVAEFCRNYRIKKKNSNATKINALRLSFEISNSESTLNEIAKEIGITQKRLKNLQKMKWSGRRVISADDFPNCSHEELSALEKRLDCEGQLRIGQKTDFQNFYLNQYCKKFRKQITGKFQNQVSATGFKVRSIVLDFDGTLTSNKQTTWEIIWELLGYTNGECAEFHGQFRRNLISHEEWCDLTCQHFRKRDFSEEMIMTVAGKIILRDEVTDVIKKLYNDGLRIYILSGSIEEIIRLVLKDVEYCFTAISANNLRFTNNTLSEIIGTEFDFENKAKYITDRVLPDNRLHPLEVLYVGNSSNDVWVSNSGARTLCVDARLTDPDEPTLWTDKINNFSSGNQLLEHVRRGSNDL